MSLKNSNQTSKNVYHNQHNFLRNEVASVFSSFNYRKEKIKIINTNNIDEKNKLELAFIKHTYITEQDSISNNYSERYDVKLTQSISEKIYDTLPKEIFLGVNVAKIIKDDNVSSYVHSRSKAFEYFDSAMYIQNNINYMLNKAKENGQDKISRYEIYYPYVVRPHVISDKSLKNIIEKNKKIKLTLKLKKVQIFSIDEIKNLIISRDDFKFIHFANQNVDHNTIASQMNSMILEAKYKVHSLI